MSVPGIDTYDASTGVRPVTASSSSVPVFYGTAERGPTEPTLVRSFAEAQEIYGRLLDGSDLLWAVKAFFGDAVGQGGGSCYIVRLVHYTDATDAGTMTGVAASIALENAAAAEVGKVTFGARGKIHAGDYGNDFSVSIEANPIIDLAAGSALTVDATAGSAVLTMASSRGIVDGMRLKVVDGATTEYVTVVGVARLDSGTSFSYGVLLAAPLANAFTAATTTIQSLEFDLSIYNYEESGVAPLEVFEQVANDTTHPNYVGKVMNDELNGSLYGVWSQTLTTGDNVPDDIDITALAGGVSAETGLTSADKVGNEAASTGLWAARGVTGVDGIAMPGETDAYVLGSILAYAENREDVFAYLDSPKNLTGTAALTWRQSTFDMDSAWGAVYRNWVKVNDPRNPGQTRLVPPSAFVAAICARIAELQSTERGPWASPAGFGVYGRIAQAVGLERTIDDKEAGDLNAAGVNCLRFFKGEGVVVWGARTLSSELQWRYVQVRRTQTWIQQAVKSSFQGATFRNNDSNLWDSLRDGLRLFLTGVMKDGGLRGDSPEEAFYVLVGVDDGVMTQGDVDNGVLKGTVGLAHQKPAEFLRFGFQHIDNQTTILDGE